MRNKMINPTLQYFSENHRYAWMKESSLQAEIAEMRAEALQAQLDYKEQQRNAKPQGRRNLLKATLARLTRRHAASAPR
jgi:hypothetical protein